MPSQPHSRFRARARLESRVRTVTKFADLTGRPYAYAPRDYRGEQVEVIYDPGDPFNGVEREFLLGRGIMLFPMCLLGALALVCFLLTLLVALTA